MPETLPTRTWPHGEVRTIDRLEMDQIRQDRAALEAELRKAGAQLKGKRSFCCPFHDDRHPSAGIWQDEWGMWRFKCQKCGISGDVFDIKARNKGLTLKEVLAPRKPDTVYPTLKDVQQSFQGVEAVYQYTDPKTKVVDLAVFRLKTDEGKSFRQVTPTEGGYTKRGPKHCPLYNRGRVSTADRVVIVEGEKCVHALHDIGIVATTSPMGATNARKADWSPLAGKKTVLWADNDEPGKLYMRQVAEQLEQLDPPATVMVVDIEALGLLPKDDVVDYLAACKGDDKREDVERVLELANASGLRSRFIERFEDVIAGRRRAIPWPWLGIGRMTRALVPDSLTVLCGEPGSGKSFFILQACHYWHKQGFNIALYELEDGRLAHLTRLLAMLAGDSRVLDNDWVESHAEDARRIMLAHVDELASFGQHLYDSPERQPTTEELASWVDERIAHGAEIVIIDAITMADEGARPWDAAKSFVYHMLRTTKRTGTRVILVTHPKKGRTGQISMDMMASGAAYQRGVHNVLWLISHHEPKELHIDNGCGILPEVVDREIRILKARNGVAPGIRIGYQWNGKKVTFRELGIVRKRPM